MVNFKNLTDKAKDLVEKRGGTDALKEDATEVKEIFQGKGSLTDKAKAAAAAVKDPGEKGEEKETVADSRKPKGAPRKAADRARKEDAS